jgi:hypothetical protein
MTETSCPQCGTSLQPSVKFCSTCGATVAAVAAPADTTADPEQVARFREHVTATLRDGTPISELLGYLIQDSTEMGISNREAIDIIEQVDAEVKAGDRAAVRVWYDVDRARAGVAFGNTILAFRVTNTSARATESVVVTVQHPLTQELVTLPPITTLNKDSSKYTETDLVFERVGRHSIRIGWVEVRKLTGASVVYRFEDVVRLNAENHEASRSHIQSISQTIQTHGGGVVSAGGLTGSDAVGGTEEAWQEVRLSLSTADAFREARRLAEARKPIPAPELSLPESVPAAPSNLSAIPQSPTSALLTWTDNATDESGFHVERSADGVSFALVATLSAESASYLVAGLPAGSRCSFRVRAFNTAGASPYSNVAGTALPELVRDTPAPPPPQPIHVVVTSSGPTPAAPAAPAPAAPLPKPPVPSFSMGRKPEEKAITAPVPFFKKVLKRVGYAYLAFYLMMIILVVAAIASSKQERTAESDRLGALEQQIADSAKAGRFSAALLLLEQLAPTSTALTNMNMQDFERYRYEYEAKRESLRNTILELQAKYEVDSLSAATAGVEMASTVADSLVGSGSAPGVNWQDSRDPRAFIEAYTGAYQSGDTARLAPFYGEKVEYFDRGWIPREDVMKDKVAYFERWPEIKTRTDSSLAPENQIQTREIKPGEFELTWRVLFAVAGRDQARSGRAINRILLAFKAGQGMVIIGESSTVTERFN